MQCLLLLVASIVVARAGKDLADRAKIHTSRDNSWHRSASLHKEKATGCLRNRWPRQMPENRGA
jgi:hypothetical protein